MTHRILCPVDGSEPAMHGVDCAIELAKSAGAPVTFLKVDIVPWDRVPHGRFWGIKRISSQDAQIDEEFKDAARKAAEHAFADFNCRTASANDLGEAIVAYADTQDCDHIVMGTPSIQGWRRWLAGSVASEVVRLAHCPVTVVH